MIKSKSGSKTHPNIMAVPETRISFQNTFKQFTIEEWAKISLQKFERLITNYMFYCS